MFYLLTCALVCLAPFVADAASSIQKEKEAKKSDYKEIDTESLKKMMDAKKVVAILDARKKLKGGLLPGAKNLPYDADDQAMEKVLGSVPKDAPIVVYCANLYCPLSKNLAERLVAKGFVNVYKYGDGVAGWLDRDYPLDPIPDIHK